LLHRRFTRSTNETDGRRVGSTKRLARTNLLSIWKTLIIDLEGIDDQKGQSETIMHEERLEVVRMSIGIINGNCPSGDRHAFLRVTPTMLNQSSGGDYVLQRLLDDLVRL
jgi:hypothetical protein